MVLEEGLTIEKARAKIWLIDVGGLIVQGRTDISEN